MSNGATSDYLIPSHEAVLSPRISRADMARIADRCGCSVSYVAKWYYDHSAVNPEWQSKFTKALVELMVDREDSIRAEIERIDGAIGKLTEIRATLQKSLVHDCTSLES